MRGRPRSIVHSLLDPLTSVGPSRSLPDNIAESCPVGRLHGIASLQQTALHLLQPLRRLLYVRRRRGGPQALGDRARPRPQARNEVHWVDKLTPKTGLKWRESTSNELFHEYPSATLLSPHLSTDDEFLLLFRPRKVVWVCLVVLYPIGTVAETKCRVQRISDILTISLWHFCLHVSSVSNAMLLARENLRPHLQVSGARITFQTAFLH